MCWFDVAGCCHFIKIDYCVLPHKKDRKWSDFNWETVKESFRKVLFFILPLNKYGLHCIGQKIILHLIKYLEFFLEY